MPELIFNVNIVMNLKTIWANQINEGCSIKLSQSDILYIKDNILAPGDPHPRGLFKFFQDVGTPHCVISELCVDTEAALSPVPIYSVPFRSMLILPINFRSEPLPENIETKYCFSFAINKKQVHRHIMAKLIDYYRFTSYQGTYSEAWRDFDMSRILVEIDEAGTYSEEFRSEMTRPIGLAKHWIEWPTDPSETDQRRGNKDMLWTWQAGLGEICRGSAVHLIAETTTYELSSMFGEKTLHAVWAGCFPLWVGGYGNAEAFERMGFDTFTDVVDHSYQYLPRLIDRCAAAIELNRRLLEDLHYVSALRSQHQVRLRKNRQRLYDGTVEQYVWQTIRTWPREVANLVEAAMRAELVRADQQWQRHGFVDV